MASNINIYARIRPSRVSLDCIQVEDKEIQVKVNKTEQGLINNQKELFKFQFDAIFQQKASQDSLFDTVAINIIDHVLQGYHGTIFVYGTTGTGKTYTMTGGNDYKDRGLMPRVLEYIFKHSNDSFDIGISYMEIYNENGYDLLDENREATTLQDLPKVSIMEDENGAFQLRNLKIKPCRSEEDAMNCLYLGDTNKMMAETPSNPQSSRSHCVFTIHIQSCLENTSKIRKSVLHLVDLAGSERVSRTGVDGKLLSEAKHINLSLHYLEQVIINLQQNKRKHVPYRNSMLTCILREALGGNCKTCMVATIADEAHCLEEGISTLRFAQRVALVSNNAYINEELDPNALIKHLKEEIKLLKFQIQTLNGNQDMSILSTHDMDICKDQVQSYIKGDIKAEALLSNHVKKMIFSLNLLKESHSNTTLTRLDSGKEMCNNEDINKLKMTLIQRDEEIKVLLQLKDSQASIPIIQNTTELTKFQSLNKHSKESLFSEFKSQYDRLEWIEDLKSKYNLMVLSAQESSKASIELKNIIKAHSNHQSKECQLLIQQYKDLHEALKVKKRNLDHHKHILDKSKSQLKTDFDQWLLERQQSMEIQSEKPLSEFEQLKRNFKL